MIFMAISTLSEWVRLSDLRREVADLSTRTAPLLARTGELARISSELRVLSDAALTAPDMAALQDVHVTRGDLFRDLDLMADADIISSTLLKNTRATFDQLLSAQKTMIKERVRIAEITSKALNSMEQFSRGLQSDHHVELLKRMFLSRDRFDPGKLATELDQLLTMSEMEVSIARLSMMTSALGSTDLPEVVKIRAQMIREVSVLAFGIARLKDVNLKDRLANQLSRYSDAVISPQQMLQAVTFLDKASRQRDEAFQDVSHLVDEVTQSLGQTSLQAASGFEQAALATEQHIGALLNWKVIMTVISALLVTTFTWSVVERGLVSRLTQLTKHVRRLAQGDVSTPIIRSARDEVGEIEEAVERSRVTAAALTRSNEELERFAYAAAHDLRSPLRAVSDLVDWTQEDFGTNLPPGARDNLEMISARVTRLSNHLTALLHYAQAGQVEALAAPFELDEFADALRTDFVAHAGFRIELGENAGPFMTCPTPVKTILLNLVSNAVKHHDQDRGRIELSSWVEGNEVILRVADDGPGIAPEHHGRIFELFQTLSEGEGEDPTGMGLALVQKLAQSLGGQVEVHSDPSNARGTCFIVRLAHINPHSEMQINDGQDQQRCAA